MVLCCGSAAPPRCQSAEGPVVTHFKGRFLGFIEDDYQYAVFCVPGNDLPGDSTVEYVVSETSAAFFLAAHVGVDLDVEVSVVGDDTLETGAVLPEYGLTRASLKEYSARDPSGSPVTRYRSDLWWADVETTLGHERAYRVFNALADSLTTDGQPKCRH